MNYIDPTLEVAQILPINLRLDPAGLTTVDWTLTEEGNDDVSFSFTSPSANFSFTDMGYFQAFSCDFFAEGIDLSPERFYILRGAYNGSTVYVGKIFVTEQDIESYSVNDAKYTPKSSTNNFVILD